MQFDLWMVVKAAFWVPLYLMAVSSSSMVAIANDLGNSDSATKTSRNSTFSRNSAKLITWSNIKTDSSTNAAAPEQQVTAVATKVEWQTENSTSSRRIGSPPTSRNPVGRNIPWQQLDNAQGEKPPYEAMDSTSSRFSSRGLRHQNGQRGTPNAACQVQWDKHSALSEAAPIETSSRIAWATSEVGLTITREQIASSTALSQDIFEGDTSVNPPSQNALQAVSTPHQQITDNHAMDTQQIDSATIDENPSLQHSQEFALIEGPMLSSTVDQTTSHPAHAIIDELPHIHSNTPQSEENMLTARSEVANPHGVDNLSEVADSISDQSIPTLLASHSGNLTTSSSTNQPVNLEKIAALQNESTRSAPIGVLPIAKLIQSDTTRSVTNTYSTERYTGPMASAEELFYNLNLTEEFQNQSGESLQAQRTSSNAEASHFNWMPGFYTWASPSFYHRPLYFEQPNLERYGMGPHHCIQPLYSGMHFFGSIALMPYKLMTQHPNERVYSLGNQRPGDPACFQRRTLLGQSQFGEVCRYWDEHSGYQ